MTAYDFFKKDNFAQSAGIELIDIKKGYGKAKMVITEMHLNAGSTTQGGAVFTLADLALAAASNSHGKLAFSFTSSITFLRKSVPGDVLYAEASERFLHNTTGYYQVEVRNQKEELIASFEATVYRKDIPLPFELTSQQ